MKTLVVTILFLMSSLAWAGSTDPTDYTVNVHVSKSYYGSHGEQRLKVLIDGHKCELSATGDTMLLALGDYKARLVKDEHRGTYAVHKVYEFLFPDKKTRKFWLVGQTE